MKIPATVALIQLKSIRPLDDYFSNINNLKKIREKLISG
jgi:hypothetical protein